jgi:hypothetical protein
MTTRPIIANMNAQQFLAGFTDSMTPAVEGLLINLIIRKMNRKLRPLFHVMMGKFSSRLTYKFDNQENEQET